MTLSLPVVMLITLYSAFSFLEVDGLKSKLATYIALANGLSKIDTGKLDW